MKIFSLLILTLVLLGAGCTQDTQTKEMPSRVQDAVSENTSLNTISTADAENALGISLPEGSEITALVDNNRAVVVSASTSKSLTATQQFFDGELQQKGYQLVRSWGVSPMDSPTLQSAAFRGNGESWSVNIRVNGNVTSYDIQRQK
jgi:serine protease inhibitor